MQKQPFFNPSTLAVIALGLLSAVVILQQVGFVLLPASLAAFILCASAVVAGIVHQQQNAFHKEIAKCKNLLAESDNEIEFF